MQAEMPFYEEAKDALKAAIQALGGTKVVGPMMWPDKDPMKAAALLSDCINPNRSEKLEITQIMLIFSMAKEAGVHGPFLWFSNEIGYEARPITKAEEIDHLTQVVEQSSKTLAAAVAALERIQKTSANGLKVVA